MAGKDKDKGVARSGNSKSGDKAATPVIRPRVKTPGAKVREGNVGNALRSVYQQTVNEDVPAEFLDLLGKLA